MRARLLVALGVLLLARPAGAIELHIHKEGLRLDITESLFAAYHGDLGAMVVTRDFADRPVAGAQFVDLLNRLNAVLSWRRFRLATRFDTGVFFDTPAGSCAPNAMADLRSRFCQRYFYPEKLSLDYNGRSVEATLGDFYVSFGRGIILSLRKLDELGIDTTLLGGKFVFHEGDTGATLVAGATNIQNVDEATGRVADDPYDAIAAGRVEHRFFDRFILGLHMSGGVNRRNANSMSQVRADSMLMYGASIDAPRLLRWLALYFEADGQMAQASDARNTYYALYGSATGYFGPVSVLVEVKHYAHFMRWRSSVDPNLAEFQNIAYNQPPTAERVLTELVAPYYDVSGPRARADWRINSSLLVYASYAYFQDRANQGGVEYHDPYAGAELRWNGGASHFFPSGGFRVERCLSNDQSQRIDPTSGLPTGCYVLAPTDDFQHIGHLEWDATQVLPKGLSLETQGQILFRAGDGELNGDGTALSWTEGNAYLALKWTPHLVFAGGFEWSTRPPHGNSPKTEFFENGSIQWNITTATSIRVFAGGMRGGLRCISGVCRIFPPFTGARLEFVLRL